MKHADSSDEIFFDEVPVMSNVSPVIINIMSDPDPVLYEKFRIGIRQKKDPDQIQSGTLEVPVPAYFDEIDDVFVVQKLQNLDLSQCRNGETLRRD